METAGVDRCPSCGREVEAGAVFCEHCGARVGQASASPPPSPPVGAEAGAGAGSGPVTTAVVPWYGRLSVVIGATLVAVAWFSWLVATTDDAALERLSELADYEFSFSAAQLLTVGVLLAGVPAVICFLKGKIIMGLIGCVVPGVSLVGALRGAKSHSLWARRRYPGGRLREQAPVRRGGNPPRP